MKLRRMLPVIRRATDLSVPRSGLRFGVHYDPEAFGRFSESIARFLGTARFLVAQTVLVTIWIAINLVAARVRWDPYPFILLNLAFSTQAAYAAPLILLAQNRQAERDRGATERDRRLSERTQADAEYLARELATIRLTLADILTTEDVDRLVDRVADAVAERIQPADRSAGGAPLDGPDDRST